MAITDRVSRFLAVLPLPAEGPERGDLRTVQALIAANCEVSRPLLARCWARAAGGRADVAERFLSGRRALPHRNRKLKSPLLVALEEWEQVAAKAKE